MSRGRFISKEICFDKKVNELSSSDSMLAFTWLIPHLDMNGCTYGEAAVVRSMVFPRRSDITIEMMESYIQEWSEKGLVVLYEYDGERFIWFPNFEKHQIGIDKRRETSSIPPPELCGNYSATSRDLCGDDSATSREECPLKFKLNDKLNDKFKFKFNDNACSEPNFYSKFQAILGPVAGNEQLEFLKELLEEHGEEKILEIAQWLHDKGETSMFKALKAINTAAPTWSKNNNDAVFSEWLAKNNSNFEEKKDGNEKVSVGATATAEQTPPAIQDDG